MSAATKRVSRKLSPDAKGVGVPMTPKRLRQLDADRKLLGMSRGGALAAIYDTFGRAAVHSTLSRSAADEAGAEAVADAVRPLVDVLPALREAWWQRARQRQRIGVSINQIAKFANGLRLMALDGKPIPHADVESIASACEAAASILAAQEADERQDQTAIAAVHALVNPARRRW